MTLNRGTTVLIANFHRICTRWNLSFVYFIYMTQMTPNVWSTRMSGRSLMMANGIDRVVEQVVNPKIYRVFKPQIDRVVCEFLGIDPDERERQLKQKEEEQRRQRMQIDSSYASGGYWYIILTYDPMGNPAFVIFPVFFARTSHIFGFILRKNSSKMVAIFFILCPEYVPKHT